MPPLLSLILDFGASSLTGSAAAVADAAGVADDAGAAPVGGGRPFLLAKSIPSKTQV